MTSMLIRIGRLFIEAGSSSEVSIRGPGNQQGRGCIHDLDIAVGDIAAGVDQRLRQPEAVRPTETRMAMVGERAVDHLGARLVSDQNNKRDDGENCD